MPRCEIVACRQGANRDLVDLPSFHKDLFVIAFPIADPLDGFIQIIGLSVRIDVHQLDGKVRVFGIRRHIKRDLDRPAYFQAFIQRIGGINENIVAGSYLPLVKISRFVLAAQAAKPAPVYWDGIVRNIGLFLFDRHQDLGA